MDVGSETHVVGEVPAIVVRIFVDDNLVAIPVPIPCESKVDRGDIPVPPVEPESIGTAAREVPSVGWTEAAAEATMLPRMLKMEACIITAGIMPYPVVRRIDVRRIGMAGLVAVVPLLERLIRVAMPVVIVMQLRRLGVLLLR